MITARTFDEVNELVEKKRSIPIDQYFDEMELDTEGKGKRIELANKFKSVFLFIVLYMFMMQQHDRIDWEIIQKEIEIRYLNALSEVIDVTNDIRNYVRNFSYNFVETTKNNVDEVWFYSDDRATFNAENESAYIWSNQEFLEAISSGKTLKTWVTMRDKRVRHTHKLLENKTIGINDVFQVGDSFMYYPKDDSLGASAQEIVSCRCCLKYS